MQLPRAKFTSAWHGTGFIGWPVVIFIACVKIWSNCTSEHTGVASEPRYRAASMPRIVKRAEKPVEFRNLMNVKWLDAGFWIAGGLVIRGFVRRQDQLDPMSPSFQGAKALDDLGKWLDAENENRHRPLR